MGKASRAFQLARHAEFPGRIAGVVVFTLGVISTIFGILDWHLQWEYGVGVLAITTAIAAIIVIRELDSPLLSVDDAVPDLAAGATHAVLHCPCDSNLRDRAKRLAGQYFDTRMNIDSTVYESLFNKNPLMLACLTDRRGALLGYFDAIPLEESFAKMFLKGLFDETQIADEVVLPPAKMSSCKYLYLAGIAVENSMTPAGKMNGRILIWAYLNYLQKYYGRVKPTVFAITTTKDGEVLAERAGMILERNAHSTAARYKLYAMQLTADAIENVLAIVPMRSSSCLLPWQHDVLAKLDRRRPIPRRSRKPVPVDVQQASELNSNVV